MTVPSAIEAERWVEYYRMRGPRSTLPGPSGPFAGGVGCCFPATGVPVQRAYQAHFAAMHGHPGPTVRPVPGGLQQDLPRPSGVVRHSPCVRGASARGCKPSTGVVRGDRQSIMRRRPAATGRACARRRRLIPIRSGGTPGWGRDRRATTSAAGRFPRSDKRVRCASRINPPGHVEIDPAGPPGRGAVIFGRAGG